MNTNIYQLPKILIMKDAGKVKNNSVQGNITGLNTENKQKNKQEDIQKDRRKQA